MRTLHYLLCAALVSVAFVAAAFAADSSRQRYDIPAGDAAAALKQFSEISGRETLFAAEAVRGVKTPAVQGELTPQEAIDALLTDTGLVATIDEKSGAIAVRRETPEELKNDASRLASDTEAAKIQSGVRIKDGAVQLEKFEVNATKVTGIVNQGVIPREENRAVRYEVITRSEIERTGLTTMPELLRRVTANQEPGTTQRMFSATVAATGNIMANGDTVNFRGIGVNQTLVMINGRRIYGSDGTAIGPDISRLPLSAVERVEILPASGSAIYGSNSVAGVINIIMRQGYSGTEMTHYVGASTGGGAEEYRFDLFHGRSFNEGRTSLSLSLSFQHFGEIKRGDRDYDTRLLNSPTIAPGTAGLLNVGLPLYASGRATIVDLSQMGLGIPGSPTAAYAAVPVGSDGIGLTPSSFAATAGTAALTTERIARHNLRQKSTNYAAILNLEHALLGDALGLYTELTFRENRSPVVYPAATTSLFLSATDPRNPFRTDVTPGFVGRLVYVYRDPSDLPDSFQNITQTTLRAVAGMKGKWTTAGGRAVNWALDGSWDRNTTETEAGWTTLSLDSASRAGVYNVLRDVTNASLLPESEVRKHMQVYDQRMRPTIAAANARLNAEVAEFWGGPVQISIGAEARREMNYGFLKFTSVGEYNFLPMGTGPSLTDRIVADTDRDVVAGYGEIFVPLVGESNRRPWLHTLELSGGIRYEKYHDFRAAKPPAAALKIGLTPDVAIRASYQEGMQPPTVLQLTLPASSSIRSGFSYVDALRPGQSNPNYLNVSSGNPALEPETAETWDVGMVLTPRVLPGLTLNVSYWRYDKANNIATLSLTQAIESYPELVVRDAPSPADVAAGRPGPVNTFYSKPVNIARQFTDGIDVRLRYDLPAREWGQVSLFGTGTLTKRYFTQNRPGQPIVDTLGIAPFAAAVILKERVSGTISWAKGPWTASWSGFYTGEFESSTTKPTARNPFGSGVDGDRLGGEFTMDLQASYVVPGGHGGGSGVRRWLAGTKWTLGVLNVADREPDLWTDALRGGVSPFVEPKQRFVYLQFRKTL